MKVFDLQQTQPGLADLLAAAKTEPILLLAGPNEEFFLSVADDFEAEVEALRNSPAFQAFLDERSRAEGGQPIQEYIQQIEREMEADKHREKPVNVLAR